MWGATDRGRAHAIQAVRFNSRTPCGVRLPIIGKVKQNLSFNSRTPCGVRRPLVGVGTGVLDVSIHAPRVGCD